MYTIRSQDFDRICLKDIPAAFCVHWLLLQQVLGTFYVKNEELGSSSHSGYEQNYTYIHQKVKFRKQRLTLSI